MVRPSNVKLNSLPVLDQVRPHLKQAESTVELVESAIEAKKTH